MGRKACASGRAVVHETWGAVYVNSEAPCTARAGTRAAISYATNSTPPPRSPTPPLVVVADTHPMHAGDVLGVLEGK